MPPLARLSGFDRSGASSTRLEKLDSNKCRHWTEFWSDKTRDSVLNLNSSSTRTHQQGGVLA